MKKLRPLVASAMLTLSLAGPSQAATYIFSGIFGGTNVVPQTSSTATGSAKIIFDDSQYSVQSFITFSGLNSNASAATLHCCTAPPIILNSSVVNNYSNFPHTTSGTYTDIFTMTSSDFALLLINTSSGRSYINIHNSIYPGGEIRANLSPAASAAPEPRAWSLMILGLGSVGAAIRLAPKRKRFGEANDQSG